MQTVQLLSDALLESLPINENYEDKESFLANRRKAIEDVLLKYIRVVGAFNDHDKAKYEEIKETQEFKDYLNNNCSNIISKELIDSNLVKKSTNEEQEGIVRSIYLTYVLDSEALSSAKDK